MSSSKDLPVWALETVLLDMWVCIKTLWTRHGGNSCPSTALSKSIFSWGFLFTQKIAKQKVKIDLNKMVSKFNTKVLPQGDALGTSAFVF